MTEHITCAACQQQLAEVDGDRRPWPTAPGVTVHLLGGDVATAICPPPCNHATAWAALTALPADRAVAKSRAHYHNVAASMAGRP